MGARQSRRSVDITTTPKKDGVPTEGGVAGDAAAPGDGKLERIEEADAKPTTNGVAPHTDVGDKDKEKDKDDATEKDKEKPSEDAKPQETPQEASSQPPAEGAGDETTTPTEETPTSPNTATSPQTAETKKKEKAKKKWSLRSISFSRKDKCKPPREETPKNGDVAKEGPLAEGGEEVEATAQSATASSPTEEKSAVSSPAAAEPESVPAAEAAAPAQTPAAAAPAVLAVEAKEEEKAPGVAVVEPASVTNAVEEKKEEPTPTAPTPVPVEEKKEEIEKVAEPAAAEKVEVSPAQTVAPIGVSHARPIATPSIIERKTSEDLPSLLPSSPPPTPIDPSPLQQAQHAAANASALAEALKVPAEAASKENRSLHGASVLSPSLREPGTAPSSSTDPPAPAFLSNGESSPETPNKGREASITPAIVEVEREPEEFVPAPAKEFEISPEGSSRSETPKSAGIEPLAVESPVKEIEPPLVPVPVEDLSISDKRASSVKSAVPSDIVEFAKSSFSNANARDVVILSEEGALPLAEAIPFDAKPGEITVARHFETPSCEKKTVAPSENGKDCLDTDKTPEVLSVQEKRKEANGVGPSEPIITAKKSEDEADEEEIPPPLPESSVPVLAKDEQALLGYESAKTEGDLPPLSTVTIPMEFVASMTQGNSEDNEFVVPIKSVNDVVICPLPPKRLVEPTEESSAQRVPAEITAVEHRSSEIEVPKIPSQECACPMNGAPPNDSPRVQYIPAKTADSLGNDLSVSRELVVDTEQSSEYPLPPEEALGPARDHPNDLPTPPKSPTEALPTPPKTPTEALPTPPRSPSPLPANDGIVAAKERSQTQPANEPESGDKDFEAVSPLQNVNSYNDSDSLESKERLAESEGTKGEESAPVYPFSNAISTAIPENDQSTPEPEVPAEKVIANEFSTTESMDEAPTSPPPAVPVEAPVSPAPAPAPAPAITEDVASVTKAIEEIEISDKIVAAAVNEAIESANTNEIITDSHHQNNLNE